MKTVGGVGFPGSPLAATKEELEQIAGLWPDIEKSRAEARRPLKEAGEENLSFELLNRNVDQPYKFNGTWVIDEWSKIGVKVTQRVLPTGPFGEAFRSGDFDAGLDGDCQNIVNPLLDTEAHEIFLLWRYRIVPYRSYVKGWKVSPCHYVNQDLATIWLDK